MKPIKRKYFAVLILFSALMTSSTASSQNILQGNVSKELKEAANQEVAMWSGELALSAKQRKLMEDKIVEFAIKRRNLLQSKMRQELKTEKLMELQVLKNRDMRDILTKPQYERYLMLKREKLEEEKNDN